VEVKNGNGAESPGSNGKSAVAVPNADRSAAPVAQPAIREIIPLARPSVVRRAVYQELQTQIHQDLIKRLNLTQLDALEPAFLPAEINRIVQEMLEAHSVPLSIVERERIVAEVRDELFGLGPLEPLLNDPTISDILVNTYKQVYIERFGKLQLTDVMFKDNDHLMQIIDRIVSRVGRRIDESSPMVDARLPDGSRVNAIIPPLAIDGPILSIRRFGTIRPTV